MPKKTYVIMSKAYSPIAITEAKPYCVCFNLKTAKEITAHKNAQAVNNEYWYEIVKNIKEI